MENENPNQKFSDLSWLKKLEITRALMEFPAQLVLVFTRVGLGLRTIKLKWFAAVGALILILANEKPELFEPFPSLAVTFAITMFGFAWTIRNRRWKQFYQRVYWHSRTHGISFLENCPLPGFMRQQFRIYRILEPICIIAAGAMISTALCRILGVGIALCGFAVHIVEQKIYEKQRELEIDERDLEIEAAYRAERMKQGGEMWDGQSVRMPGKIGVPAGFAADVERQMRRRQQG